MAKPAAPRRRLSQTPPTTLALASLGVAGVVIALKLAAWQLTGSVALFSDALESVVNVASAAATLWAVHLSQQPADAEHPFGHHKAEYLSAVLVGVLIVGAAVLIMHGAVSALMHPAHIIESFNTEGLGLAVNALASVVNAGWAWCLMRCARRQKSPALAADAKHLWSDVVTSVGVIVGLVLAIITGYLWLDAVLALLVALHILVAGAQVITSSVDNLLDRAVDPATARRLRRVISQHAKGALEVHDVRTRIAGRATFIEFHLVMPGQTTVAEAHELCDRLEDALHEALPGSHVTIHVEPEGEARHDGVLVL